MIVSALLGSAVTVAHAQEIESTAHPGPCTVREIVVESGHVVLSRAYSYDASGRLTTEVETWTYGDGETTTRYEYDDDGNLVVEDIYVEQDELFSRTRYIYGALTRCTTPGEIRGCPLRRETDVGGNGFYSIQILYDYSADGALVSATMDCGSPRLCGRMVHRYEYQDGRLASSVLRNEADTTATDEGITGAEHFTYTYDLQGWLVTVERRSVRRTPVDEWESLRLSQFSYDETGNVLLEEAGNGTRIRTEYEYGCWNTIE